MSIALVQQAIGNSSGASTVAVTIAAPAAGNSLIAIVQGVVNSGTPQVTGITGGGVTWVQAVTKTWILGLGVVDIWYGHGSSGVGTTVTVTVNNPGTGIANAVNVSEWSGIAGAPEATNNNKGDNVNNVISTNAVTPVSVSSLVIASMAYFNTTYSSGPTSSFTRMTNVDVGSTHLEGAYQIESAVAADSTTVTIGATTYWGATIAAFGAAASGGILGTELMSGGMQELSGGMQ